METTIGIISAVLIVLALVIAIIQAATAARRCGNAENKDDYLV